MKPKILIIALFSFMTLTLNAQDKIFEGIENKTWFDETGFAGESIVFIKSDSGRIQAIRQINGSGVPVVYTVIHDVEIHNDSILLLNTPNRKADEKQNIILYIYSDQGLYNNGNKLRVLIGEPIIYVCTEKRNILDIRLNVNNLTRISLEKNEVYINDDLFKINVETE